MENNNSVCFVGKVEKLVSIEGADKIEQAWISGWECVVQKERYRIGQLLVVATTDAVIPFELAEQLGVTNYLKHRKKTNQYTVRTTKLRGVYSQALVIAEFTDEEGINEGEDMMNTYGIFKYEEPEEIIQTPSGKKLRFHKNENFHIYYKFPNAKNVPDMFHPDDDVIITRKIHGTNFRAGVVRKTKITLWDRIKGIFNPFAVFQFVYGSHTVEKGGDNVGFYGVDVWREIVDKYGIKEKLWKWIKRINRKYIMWEQGIIVYGEIYGPGIQKYFDYGEKEHKLKIFDIKMEGNYCNYKDFKYFNNQYLQLPEVDEVYEGPFSLALIQGLLSHMINSKVPHEGVVVRTHDMSKIAKFISPLYNDFQSKKEDSTDFH